MLVELTRIESSHGEARVQDVIRTIHHLMTRQFIYAGDRGTAVPYNTATDPRFSGFIGSYFDAAGYDLVANEAEQWIGIIPRMADVALPKMRIDETIALLTLAIVWQDSVNAGDVQDRATVLATMNSLFERYESAVARSRKTAIPIARFVEIMKDFQRRSIVDLGLYDPEEQDQEVTIRPLINRLVGADAMVQIERFARDEESSLVQLEADADDSAAAQNSDTDESDATPEETRP